MRFERSGEPYGATAMPPRSRTPLWLVLAKLTPPLTALSAFLPWLLVNCPSCLQVSGSRDLPMTFLTWWPESHPWLLAESWALVIAALVVSWSLGLRGRARTGVRRAGLALGAFALGVPLAFGLGVATDPGHLFVFSPAPGLWLALVAYVAMAVSSEKA